MYFEKTLMANAQNRVNYNAHWEAQWGHRRFAQVVDNQMVANAQSANMEVNAGVLTQDFWRATDAQIIELRNQEVGMDIVNDLLTVQTVIDIGFTAKTYNRIGGIDNSVSISLDGKPPVGFDHVAYDQDGDPIPIITAGYGANWRHTRGLANVGADILLDSQRAKTREYNKKVVGLVLDGAANINVGGYQSQGLRTHRNTKKIDLDASGANINLTTATVAQMIAFFQGAFFGGQLRTNFVTQLDVLWVSPEINANLGKVYVENGVTVGTGRDYLLKFIAVKDIRQTFALSGNEMLGYVRDKDTVTPLVGMPTNVIAIPRRLPHDNYNFLLMGAMGLQVKADSTGKSGVFYFAEFP